VLQALAIIVALVKLFTTIVPVIVCTLPQFPGIDRLKLNVPAIVGVPLIETTPLLIVQFTPLGSPDTVGVAFLYLYVILLMGLLIQTV
jgi:hypothetical protein